MEIRLNIYNEKGKWVGQEYLTEKGKWLHRWTQDGKLEKGSWRGRAKGDNELNWIYKLVTEYVCRHCKEFVDPPLWNEDKMMLVCFECGEEWE